jgi:hypothetical protein
VTAGLDLLDPTSHDLHVVAWQAVAMDRDSDLIVVGYGKVPVTSASHSINEFFAICLRIDPASHAVTEVDSTAVTGLVRAWIAETLIGIDFSADIEPIVSKVDRCYLGNAAGSIKQALHDAWRRYAAHREPRTHGKS